MDWRHSDKQKYFRHIWHWKAKRLKKEQNKARNRKQSRISHIHFNMKRWKFPNSSSHTVINRQEDVILETVFIEGLTNKFFFSLDIKQQFILVWGQKTLLIQSIFICSSINVACTLSCGKAPVYQQPDIASDQVLITGLKLWAACPKFS